MTHPTRTTLFLVAFAIFALCFTSVQAYPENNNGTITTITVDPWYFSERLAIYENLINQTFIPGFFSNNDDNVLWGLPLQFEWQNRSGRLPRNNTSPELPDGEQRIRYDSWWASMNYYLSVIPFLGAIDAGLFGSKLEFVIVPPQSPEYAPQFCFTPESCDSQLISKWSDFFKLTMELQSEQPVNITKAETLQATLWTAHIASIHYAGPLFNAHKELPSKPEADFGDNWSLFVDFIAAATFPSNYYNISFLQPELPPRELKWDDIPGIIPDFDVDQNRVLVYLELLQQLNTRTNGFVLEFFQEAVKTPAGEAEAQYLIANGVQHPLIFIKGVIILVENAIIAELEHKKSEKLLTLLQQIQEIKNVPGF